VNYRTAAGMVVDDRLDGVYQGAKRVSGPKWKLPIELPPEPDPVRVDEWVNITKFGAVPDPSVDSTAAFMAALKSNARVIYIPTGQYFVNKPIPIGDDVERIEGMFSVIRTGRGYRSAGTDTALSLFSTSPLRRKALFIRRLTVERDGDVFAVVDHHAPAPLVLSDISAFAAVNRFAEGGPVFGENLNAGYFYLAGSAGAWFRQLDTEGRGVRIRNKGSPLWVLGAKSEQTSTLVRTTDGGDTEIVGGLVYRVYGTDPQVPLFVNIDGRLSASYAEEAFRRNAFYTVHLDSTINGQHTTVGAETFPKRNNIARIVPSLSTDD